MALASLCAGLVKYQPARERYNFEFMAFIVDHRAREGSDFEAKKTKNKLYSMGIGSQLGLTSNGLT